MLFDFNGIHRLLLCAILCSLLFLCGSKRRTGEFQSSRVHKFTSSQVWSDFFGGDGAHGVGALAADPGAVEKAVTLLGFADLGAFFANAYA